MEDLQDALQSILSDPEQMARVAALAESLGLKPPDPPPQGEPLQTGHSEQREETASSPSPRHFERSEESAPRDAPKADFASTPFLGPNGPELGRLMSLLSATGGSETRVLSALRPTLSAEGQSRVDRALRAARLSRLASELLRQGGPGNV